MMESLKESPKRRVWKLTLIEVLLVLLIVAGLAAVLVPNFVRCTNYGPVTACKSNLKNLATGLEMYAEDHQGHYPSNLSQLTPNYLKVLPECPTGGASYRASFGPGVPFNKENAPHYFLLECTGDNHTEFKVPPDFPKYSSDEGLLER